MGVANTGRQLPQVGGGVAPPQMGQPPVGLPPANQPGPMPGGPPQMPPPRQGMPPPMGGGVAPPQMIPTAQAQNAATLARALGPRLPQVGMQR